MSQCWVRYGYEPYKAPPTFSFVDPINTETYVWEAPVPRLDDVQMYKWDEETTSWVVVE